MSEKQIHDPFASIKRPIRKELPNEHKLVEQLAKENGFVSSPVLRNKAVRKHFTMMEDNIKALKLSTRNCEDLERDGSRITESEVMRTALRAFCELPYEEQYEKVKQNQYSEGK